MGIINVLDTQTANLIAAGEVVERPASVVKELCENSIDAGATRITVEIKNGGVSYIRVTDNGSGMSKDDAVNCVLRHATSKISSPDDLAGIATLGFRGEALAAISSVCEMRIMTKRPCDDIGTLVCFDEEMRPVVTEAGCPDGTSMIVENLFYNVPARRKFLKKDFSEAMAVSSAVERIAVSHPEISVQYIIDNKVKYTTKGDGKLDNAVYAALGKEFFSTLDPILPTSGNDDVFISGYISKAEKGRTGRSMQYMFLNGRTVRSKTVSAALEEGFRTYMPEGLFPCCVMFIDVDVHTVDVNVHPTKQEVKFTDERKIFNAVYYAVKNTLTRTESRPELIPKPDTSFASGGAKLLQSFVPVEKSESVIHSSIFPNMPQKSPDAVNIDIKCDSFGSLRANDESADCSYKGVFFPDEKPKDKDDIANEEAARLLSEQQKQPFRIIGEAYNCYIFVELSDRIMVIDKHAAHERILYNELLNYRIDGYSQMLLDPVTVTLSSLEMSALSECIDRINESGFDISVFGSDGVIVRQIPLSLVGTDIPGFITSLASSLCETGKGRVTVRSTAYERALFTAACKAAMKGGQKTSEMLDTQIAERVLTDKDVRFCPHGRPVAYEIKKSSLENQFGR